MKTNMSAFDRLLRILIAVAILMMYYKGVIDGTLGLIGLIVAGVFMLTSLISYCPLYSLFKLSTKGKPE